MSLRNSVCNIKIEANDNIHILSQCGGSTGQLRSLDLRFVGQVYFDVVCLNQVCFIPEEK